MSEERILKLYRSFGPVVYRRCLRLLRDPDWAKDATQDVFLRLSQRLDSLDDEERALPWIYSAATRHCLNLRREAARRQKREEVALEVLPQSRGLGFDEARLGQQLLSRFDATTQAVAVGVLVDGFEHEELAQTLEISSKTVSRKLQKFLINARKYLARSVES